MKFLLSILLFTSIAIAEEECPPEQQESISTITALGVPNCIDPDKITSEIDLAIGALNRQKANEPTVSTAGPVCKTCQDQFKSRLPSSPAILDKKKSAAFAASYKELEKSLSSIVVDMVGLRKTWSTNSNFNNSVQACDTKKIESELRKCNSPFLNEFKGKGLSGRLANEVASLVSNNSKGVSGILDRSGDTSSCQISDEAILNLKPRLFEEMITPDIVRKISGVKGSSTSELQANLHTALSVNYEIIEKHPVLRELVKEPRLFLQTFQSLKNENDPAKLKDKFKAKIYSSEMGNLIDSKNAEKCEQTISSFTSTLCSEKVKNGQVTLGPFSNYKKFLDADDIDKAAATTSEELLKNNLLMFEFCSPATSSNYDLKSSLDKMNGWMLPEDRDANLSEYSSIKYNRDFGDVKGAICGYMPNADCPAADGEQCALYKLYRKTLDPSTPEGRLANSPDRSSNRVLERLIGDTSSVTGSTKEILIAEGIIPQANGQFVEREVPRERQPEYLAGVADGSITPSSTTTPPVLAQTPINRQQRPQQQVQPATFQPQVANSAAPETQVAANTTDDDQDDLRRFQDGLEERRRRAEGSQENRTRPQQQAQTNRRAVSRQDSSERSENSLPTADIAPIAQPQAQAQAFNNAVPNSTPGTASLGRDTSRRGLADRQRQAALADMDRKNQPQASGEAGRSPASVEGQQTNSESKVALTISGDIRANLERVLQSSGADGVNLRSLIQNKRTFKFELNNSIFDVQFNNNGYVVRPSSNPNARTLQEVFNDSLRTISERTPANQRTATLPDLNRDLENTGRN